MPKPSLSEIFGGTTVAEKPSLDSIFKGTSPDRPSLDSIFNTKPSLDNIFKPSGIQSAVKVGKQVAGTLMTPFTIAEGGVGPISTITKTFLNPEVERTKSVTALVGAPLALGPAGLTFPALKLAESAFAPLLEDYVSGNEIHFKDMPEKMGKSIKQNFKTLLGMGDGEAPSLSTAGYKAVKILKDPKLFGMALDTEEKKKAYGEIIQGLAYIATAPGMVSKGLKMAGEGIKTGTERVSAIPQIAKERALYGEQQRILESKIAVKNPEMTPEQVKATAEVLSGGKIGKVEPAISETAIKTMRPTLPDIFEGKTPITKVKPAEVIPTPPKAEIAPVIEDLKGEMAEKEGVFKTELDKAMKQPYEMTQEEFGNIPVIKYIKERLNDKTNPMVVSERNQLADQLVQQGIMTIDEFNAMTGQHGFGGVTGVKNLTTGKPIPSKPIDLENDMGARINYIGQWHQFRVSSEWFGHIHTIRRAMEEGKIIPQNVLEEYRGSNDGTGDTGWADRELFKRKYEKQGITLEKKESVRDGKDEVMYSAKDRSGKVIARSDVMLWNKEGEAIKQIESDISKLSPKESIKPLLPYADELDKKLSPKEGGAQKQAVAYYIDEFAKKLSTETGQPKEPFVKMGQKLVDDIKNKNVVSLRSIMNGINPNSNKLFTQITGLPSKLQREVDESLRSMNPEAWDASKYVKKPVVETPKMSKEEALKKAQSTRSEKALSTNIRFRGTVMTKKSMIDKLSQEGATSKVWQENVIKDMTRSQNNRADGRQQEEHARRQKEAGLKNVYYISDPSNPGTFFQVGKTEYDYFNSLKKPLTQAALKMSDSANGLLLQASKEIPGLNRTQANIYAGDIAEHEKHSEIEANDMAEAIQYADNSDNWINTTTLTKLFDYTHKTDPIWDRIKELNFNKLIDKEFEQSLSHVKSLIADLPKDAKELLRMYINSNNEIVIEGENRNRKIVQGGLDKIEKILEDYHSKNNTGDDPNQKMAQALKIAQTPESTEEEVSTDKSMAEKGFKLIGERKDNVPIANLSQFMRTSDKQVITADGAISNGRWAIKKGILPNVDKKFTSPNKIDNYTLEKLTDIKGLGRSWEKLKEWGTFEGDENVYLLDKSNEVYAIDKKYYDYIVKNIKNVSFEGISFNRPVKIYSGDKLVGIILGKESDNANRMKAYLKQPISTPSGNAMGALWHNDIPIEQGTEYYKLRSFETPELVRLVREVMGKYPDVVKKTGKAAGRFIGPREMVGNARIKIVAELFKQGNEKELGIVIAHEFGHLTDYMPEGTLKRGNILGRLLTLRSYLKQTFGEGTEEISNKEIRTELIAVTKYMHPFDEKTVPPAYKSYRLSSKELYAEAISLLLNSPGTMEKMAPKFTKAFFENLDKKIDVKEAYFDLLELLNGERSDVLDALDKDIRRMFAKADPLRKQKLAEKKVATVSTWEKIRQHLDNKYHPIIKRIENLEKMGTVLPADQNPKYILEEFAMSNNLIYDWLLNFDNAVKNPLKEAGLDNLDFASYTFLKRIIGSPQLEGTDVDSFDDMDKDQLGEMIDASTGKPYKEEFTDRKNIANPLGIQPKRAQEQLDFLKTKLGPEKFAKLEAIATKFHELVFKVVQEAVKVGSYNAKVFAERIEPNKDTYVSFGVINYLQNFVSAGIKKQIGTLNEIEDPVMTTILKTVSLIKLNEKQRMLNSVRNMLAKHFPEEITKSKKHRTTGGGVDWTETSSSMKMLEDGRMVSYEVDPYIARSLKYDPYAGEIGNVLNAVLGNNIFKDIVITYNPGFAFAFNPIRDFTRTYKSLNAVSGKVSLRQLLIAYVKALPQSYKRIQGINEQTVTEMISNRALDIPFSDFHAGDYTDNDGAYNELLKRYKLAKNPEELQSIRKTLLKPVVKLLEFIRFHGSALESVSKIAGYNILKSRDVAPAERAFITRNYIGTPNFRTKGLSTEITNAVFIFSNIMKEGMKADYYLATNPKTRSGYWWATAKTTLLPKVLMAMAAAGLFGAGIKKLFDKIGEYDKTNYIIIPVGEANGKPIYIRIPHDETGRLISAITWKLMGVLQGKPDQLQQIFAFGAGQMPQLTPLLSVGEGWMQYLTGNNPYEPFRGGNVLSDTEYKAGGMPALKKMVLWTAGELGLTQFFTYSKDSNSTFETTVKSIPILNRLLRVSDSGSSEELRQIRKEVDRESAQRVLLKREEFKDGAKRFDKGENPLQILKDISQQVYPGKKITRQDFTFLQKGLVREILKGKTQSPYVDALIYAVSNEEKKRILFKMKEKMSFDSFISQAKVLRNLKIYSNEVMTPDEWRELLKQK